MHVHTHDCVFGEILSKMNRGVELVFVDSELEGET